MQTSSISLKRIIYSLLGIVAAAVIIYLGSTLLIGTLFSSRSQADPTAIFNQYFDSPTQPNILYSQIVGFQDHTILFIFRSDEKIILDAGIEPEIAPQSTPQEFRKGFINSEYYSLMDTVNKFDYSYYQRKNSDGQVNGHYVLAKKQDENIYFFRFNDY